MTKKLPAKAFSFLEISIVIVIIGLLISAILSGAEMVNEARLTQARSMTRNSPVVNISGLVFWLDTTSEQSFLESEAKEDGVVSRWNDIRPESSAANYLSNSSGTAADHPVYKENCINGLPCLYFNGTAGSKVTTPRSLGIRTKYISAFLVFTGSESATSSYSSTIFNSDVNAAWDSNSGIFLLTTAATSSKYFFYNMPSSYGVQYTQCTLAAAMEKKQKYIYSVVDDNSSSIFHYINGAVANTAGANNSGALTKTLGTVGIGNASYQGNIGEIIIFNKAVTTAERKSIEQYLSKKWDIKISS